MTRLVLFILFILPFFVFSQHEDAMEEANKFYNNGQYENAVDQYQDIVNKGYHSADLYCNLANSYYKIDDIAHAILYFEKAKKLKPRDKDIQYNLAIANNQKLDRIESVPEAFWQKWWRKIMNLFSADTWSVFTVIFLCLFFFLLAVFLKAKNIFFRKLSFWLGFIVLIICVHSFVFAFQYYKNNQSSSEAIVFNPSLSVKSSPDHSSVNLFVIHEGTKVELLENLEEWSKIKIASGGQGWVVKTSLKEI